MTATKIKYCPRLVANFIKCWECHIMTQWLVYKFYSGKTFWNVCSGRPSTVHPPPIPSSFLTQPFIPFLSCHTLLGLYTFQSVFIHLLHSVRIRCKQNVLHLAKGQYEIWKEKKRLQQSLKWEYHSRAKSEVILKLENNICCIWTCNELTDQILHVSLEGVATEIRQVKDVKKYSLNASFLFDFKIQRVYNEKKSKRKVKHWNTNVHNFTVTKVHMIVECSHKYIQIQTQTLTYTEYCWFPHAKLRYAKNQCHTLV